MLMQEGTNPALQNRQKPAQECLLPAFLAAAEKAPEPVVTAYPGICFPFQKCRNRTFKKYRIPHF